MLTLRCTAHQPCHTVRMPSTGGLRARVRAELMQEIKDEARRQMAEEGASSLSLRAIARHLDMVSSGIYRYFKSRDELLTALIVDAYEAIGSAVETADKRCDRSDFTGRWSACCHAVRDWALVHPHEYALIYGSPVPGYHAPEETNPPASRVALGLVTIIHEAAEAGDLRWPFAAATPWRLSKSAAAEAARLKAIGFNGVPDDAIIRSLAAWTQLFGAVNFEVFGRIADIVEDADAVFDQSVRDMSAFVGFVEPTPTAGQ
jgi:AcrR family transcriptional regulator